jgi:plastocyanin
MTIKFAAGYTNTSTATLNVNSLGAKALLDNRTSAALKPSDIEALKLYTVVYDSFLNSFLVLDCSRSANQSFYKSGASVINTTSTSITTMTSMSQAVTVKVGDIVMVTGDASMSHSAIYGQAKLAILKDSVAVSPEMTVREHDDTSTAGRSISQSVNYCETIATAGTYTYALGWETNAGTLYSEQRCMSIIVLARN